jgi:hypothetical protein
MEAGKNSVIYMGPILGTNKTDVICGEINGNGNNASRFHCNHSMHCDYKHPHSPTNAYNLYEIKDHLCRTLLHVSAMNCHS